MRWVIWNLFYYLNLAPTVDHELVTGMQLIANFNIFNSCSWDWGFGHWITWRNISLCRAVQDHGVIGAVCMIEQVSGHFLWFSSKLELVSAFKAIAHLDPTLVCD